MPGLEGCREGVKTVLNAQLARTGAMKRLPPNTRKHFHRHLSVREIETLILRYHHAIGEQFQAGAGLTLQFIESRVLVRCLLQLIDKDLVALPVHDALLVPQSQIAPVAQVMRECFREVTGVEAALSIEGESVDGSPLSPSLLSPAGLPWAPMGPSLDALGREDVGGDDGGVPSSPHASNALRSPVEGRISMGAVLGTAE